MENFNKQSMEQEGRTVLCFMDGIESMSIRIFVYLFLVCSTTAYAVLLGSSSSLMKLDF